MSRELLEVRSLSVSYHRGDTQLTAVEDVTFSVGKGEIVTLVGESGSGKSTIAMTIARLNEGQGITMSGHVELSGTNVLAQDESALYQLRGQGIAMIFQDAATSLNPCETIGDQIAETFVFQRRMRWSEARNRANELLAEAGLPEPKRRARCYPHQLSGGQRQRAMIALALACTPQLLIADEPTTALDVTIQAQILALLKTLVRARDMGMLLITHDLGVVAAMADRVLVIYAGRIVETGLASKLIVAPRHPYTRALINAAIPDTPGRLATIPGMPTQLETRPAGCSFAPRCTRSRTKCHSNRPPIERDGNSSVACFFPD